jgi:hypothetical protein
MSLISQILSNKIIKLKSFSKIFSACFVILIFSFSFSFSQGFDWQYSSRMPYTIPDFFVGLNVGYGSVSEIGDFNLKEDLIECCKFGSGDGKSYFFGITSEYWYDGYTSYNLGISYSASNSNFVIRSSVPTRNGEFVTDYGMNSTISYTNIDLGIKRRVFDTHFNYGGGLLTSILLSGNSAYTEQGISDNVPFEKRTISNGKIEELNGIVISPYIFAGYDADLGIGYYATPNISLSYNIISIVENDPWRRFSFSVGVKIFRSLE